MRQFIEQFGLYKDVVNTHKFQHCCCASLPDSYRYLLGTPILALKHFETMINFWEKRIWQRV
jgi:hypothetical protein